MFFKAIISKIKIVQWSKVTAVLLLAVFTLGLQHTAEAKKKAIRVLMVGGGSSHDFDKWYKGVDVNTLQRDGLATVTYTSDVSTILGHLPEIDVLMLANNQPMEDPALRKAIFAFVAAGKGLVLAHPALWYNWQDWPEYNKQLVSGGSNGHDAYGLFNVTVVNKKHPVTKGVDAKFSLKDELYYYKVDPSGPGINILAQAQREGSNDIFPSVFVVNHPKARILAIALGHDAESHELPAYQTLLRNAVKWVSRK